MDTRTIKSEVKRAWVLTWEIRVGGKLDRRLEGILDASIPSTTMLKFVEHISVCRQLTAQEQMSCVENRKFCPEASFVYLNDGSLFKDLIVCSAPGKNRCLIACRAYDLVIYSDLDGVEHVSWKEKHLTVENGRRRLYFWDDLSLPLPLSNGIR